jgi:SAM-dependent methyltransferase
MRRFISLMGVAAAATVGAGVFVRTATWARWRNRLTMEIGPGAMPGELGSRMNSWLNTELYAQVAAELDLRPDDELLDVACGAGAFLAEHGARARYLAGLDLSPAKVSLARRRLADRIAAGTAEISQGDAGALPWEDGRFSAVTTMDAIGWFPDPAKAVKEMYRVLRPGGRALLQVGFTGKAFGGALTVMSEPDVRRMTEAAGFAEISTTYRPTAGNWRIYDALLRLFGWEQTRLVRAVRPAAIVPEEAPAGEMPELVGSA